MNKILTVTTEHGELNLLKYSEKCAVVSGSATYGIRTELKKLNGKFNNKLKCGPGWIFTIDKTEVLKDLLKKVETKEKERETMLEEIGFVTTSMCGLDAFRKVGDKFICRKSSCKQLTDNNCGFCKKHHSSSYHDHDKKICVHYRGTLYMYKNTEGEIYFKNLKK